MQGNDFALATLEDLLTNLISTGWDTDIPMLATFLQHCKQKLINQKTKEYWSAPTLEEDIKRKEGTEAFHRLMNTMKAHGVFEPPKPPQPDLIPGLMLQLETGQQSTEQIAQNLWQAGHAMDKEALAETLQARDQNGRPLLNTLFHTGNTQAVVRYLSLIEPVILSGRLNEQQILTLLQAPGSHTSSRRTTEDSSRQDDALMTLLTQTADNAGDTLLTLMAFVEQSLKQPELALQLVSGGKRGRESDSTYLEQLSQMLIVYPPADSQILQAQQQLQGYCSTLADLYQNHLLTSEQILKVLHYITQAPLSPSENPQFIQSVTQWVLTGNVFTLNRVSALLNILITSGSVDTDALSMQLQQYRREVDAVKERCPKEGIQAFNHLMDAMRWHGVISREQE